MGGLDFDGGDVPSVCFAGGRDPGFLTRCFRRGSGRACDSYRAGRSTLSLLGCRVRAAVGLDTGALSGRVLWYDCARLRGFLLFAAVAPD